MNTNYKQRELLKAEEKHDWTYNMTLKLSGSEFSSRWICVNEEQYKKLLEIFKESEGKQELIQ